MLSASIFLFVASTAARTSECDRPPAILRRAYPPSGINRRTEVKPAATRPLPRAWRETRLAPPGAAPHVGCVSFACPGAIVMGVGF